MTRYVRRSLVCLLPLLVLWPFSAAASPATSAAPVTSASWANSLPMHPFGEPQTVLISAEGSQVNVQWRVGAGDDVTALGVHIGALDESRVMLDGAIAVEPTDVETVGEADALSQYVLGRISVRTGGHQCSGTVGEVVDLIKVGVPVSFECDQPVRTAAVSVRTLTDIHPAYRTLARGPGNQRAAYDGVATTHEWTFAGASTAARSARPSATVPLALFGTVLISILGFVVLMRRRGFPVPQRTE